MCTPPLSLLEIGDVRTRAHKRTPARMCVFTRARARARVERLRMCASPLWCPLVARRRPAVLIAPATAPGGRACAVAVKCDRLKVSRAFAAGVTWTCRTASAPWAGRYGHTSVVDAAGAIYVIGGAGGTTLYSDVWVSTDGGARPFSVGGGGRGGRPGGYSGGPQGH